MKWDDKNRIVKVSRRVEEELIILTLKKEENPVGALSRNKSQMKLKKSEDKMIWNNDT